MARYKDKSNVIYNARQYEKAETVLVGKVDPQRVSVVPGDWVVTNTTDGTTQKVSDADFTANYTAV